MDEKERPRMDEKERLWHIKKIGKFSASCAKDLMSASGKWIEGNIDYLYEIQQQRLTDEPEPPIFARPMQLGTENEPYAIGWAEENYPDMIILNCDKDFTEKIFEETDFNYGASPDAFIMCPDFEAIEKPLSYNVEFKNLIQALLEVKCVIGRKMTNRYFSPTLPFEEKRMMALKEHGWQMAGQLLAYPYIHKIYLLKYLPQLEDLQIELCSPTGNLRGIFDPARGLMFEYSRVELSMMIGQVEQRVRFADAYLKSGKDLEKINEIKTNV